MILPKDMKTNSQPSPLVSSDERLYIRYPLLGELSGSLIDARTKKSIRSLALNVSREGLSLVVFERLVPDQKLLLFKEGLKIPLRVVWCRADAAKVCSFSCGVHCTDPNIDLKHLFLPYP